MPIELTGHALREVFPRAPQPVIDAFASPEGQAALDKELDQIFGGTSRRTASLER